MTEIDSRMRDVTKSGSRPGAADAGTAARRSRHVVLPAAAAVGAALIAGVVAFGHDRGHAAVVVPPPPVVTVSAPLVRGVTPRTSFLGQFSAVDQVDLRAQVGGLLTEIHFTDGQIVHAGDLLFVIDPRPYRIRLEQAVAQYRAADAQLSLAGSELWRAQQLKHTDFGTAQNVDQRLAAQLGAQAARDQAMAAIHDAQLDLEYCRVTAPFTGRISAHRVSIGSLVSGSRGGSGTSTLLTTIVSLDPIHLDFDMSEADFLAYQRSLQASGGQAIDRTAAVSLGDEARYTRTGRLDFVDNALDRGSGTIHARATLPNPGLFIAPGEFARLRLPMDRPEVAMLIPAAAVMLDQSQQMVMTVAADGTVIPRIVEVGNLQDGLRVVRRGLRPSDRIVIDGLMRAAPGMKVDARPGVIHPADDGQG